VELEVDHEAIEEVALEVVVVVAVVAEEAAEVVVGVEVELEVVDRPYGQANQPQMPTNHRSSTLPK